MPYHVCEVCKKTYYSKDKVRRFCGKECRETARSMGLFKSTPRGEGRHKRSKEAMEAQAKARASDSQNVSEKPLVDPKKCNKCIYALKKNHATSHCGYVFITGRTRTAQHPEGLTSECHEFSPKPRKRKKASTQQ